MLKFRIIFSSFLFLLLVGMNSHARASVMKTDAVENSADDQQSEKKSKEHRSGEMITQLDFFGAFSLVNVQLQWRDLFVDKVQDDVDTDSDFDPNEIFVEASDVQTLSVEQINLLSPLAIFSECCSLSFRGSQPIQHATRFDSIINDQQASIIAYIQNSGTYPKS